MPSDKSLILLFVFVCLAGCITSPLPSPVATLSQATSKPTLPLFGPTLSTTPTLIASLTSSPTVTPRPSPSATHQPGLSTQFQVKRQLLTVESSPNPENSVEGVLVLQGNVSQDDTAGYLLDLGKRSQLRLPTDLNGRWVLFDEKEVREVVSPNRKWLAYTEASGDLTRSHLWVVTSDGKPLPIPDREGWFQVVGWFDDERLGVTKRGYYSHGIETVLNPFTGEEQSLEPTYPITSPEGKIFSYPDVFYDPTLTRVTYSWVRSHSVSCLLWDVISDEILWEREALSCYRPVWSPDGKHLTQSYYTLEAEGDHPVLSILDTNGQEIVFLDTVSGGSAWSPDGRRIAAQWVGAQLCSSEIDRGLAVVDLVVKEITVYCIDLLDLRRIPIWSPDGKWIAINRAIDEITPGVIKPGVFLIDLVQNRVFEVNEGAGMWVIGWMATP